MPAKHQAKSNQPGLSLGESATHFLASVLTDTKLLAQQEILKFIRWFGEGRKADSLTGQEISNYSEQTQTSSNKAADHLNTVKLFLRYLYSEGYAGSNLGTHIKIKKTSGKPAPGVMARDDEPVLLTPQGFAEAKNKLAHLQTERPRIAEEIRKAAADKDFRENAPLHAAREQMSLLDGQIKELEDTLRRARVVEAGQESGQRISIGDAIIIEEVSSRQRISYTLVSSREADVKSGKISVISPMGQALVNREIGETISVNAPSGINNYRVIEINKIK